MKKTLPIIIIAVTFIWVGMVCGISFLEAPLKFQAPGITLPLGLGIGKLVFGALTKIEMVFSLIIIASLFICTAKFKTWILFLTPVLIVIIDNALLMPILDARRNEECTSISHADGGRAQEHEGASSGAARKQQG